MMLDASVSAPADNRTVVELAQQYAIYSAAMWISKYYIPVLVPFGIAGNILSFLVMTMPRNRAKSCCNYMVALSICDNCMMCAASHAWWVSVTLVNPLNCYVCKVVAFAFNLFSVVGIYLIVFMTIDRFIAVRFPFHKQALCTVRRARITIGVICITSVIYTGPYIYTTGVINGTLCSSVKYSTMLSKVYSWTNILVTSVIPFVSLLIFNTVIIKTIHQQGQSFDEVSGRTHVVNSDKQLTIMLMLISFSFLFLTLPVCIRYILAVMLDYENNPYHNAVYTFVYHLSQKLYFTNSAINFYMYCISGSRFRDDLKRLCRRQRQRYNIDSSVGSIRVATAQNATVDETQL